jgi:hydroxycarboxylate dehydrogenase B
MTDVVLCRCEPLERFVAALFQAAGADCDVAGEVARHLVRANLSGHDSHGVIRIPQYFAQIAAGEMQPTARPSVVRETAVTALIDAHRGLGQFATAFALDWAAAHALEHGLAAAAIRHATHIGRLGEYTERAAARGLIAILTVGVGGPGLGGMLLFGSRQRFFGANPWSIAVPAEGRPPMVFDGSSSAVAEGKVRLARSKAAALPEGAIADREGRPSTDPEAFYAGGGLLPLGGAVAGHKGYGLAMASVLVGALAMIGDADPALFVSSRTDVADTRGRAGGVFLVLVDPGRFGDAADYRAMVADVLAAAKRAPCAPGVSEILVPGEPEVLTRARRACKGIPIPVATWTELADLATRWAVTLPPLD